MRKENIDLIGIYKITNTTNGMMYIGSSFTIFSRFKQHVRDSINGVHKNKKLQNAFNEFGYSNFSFEILKIFHDIRYDELLKEEQKVIDSYDKNILYNNNNASISGNNFSENMKFIKYINNRWLVPIGIEDKELDLYKIWRQEDKEAIVEMAIKCKIYSLCKSQITFNKVISTLIETLGYEIITDRYTVNKQKHTYKLIISFDEDKLIFVKPYKGIND